MRLVANEYEILATSRITGLVTKIRYVTAVRRSAV
jgi:hypothetical protein